MAVVAPNVGHSVVQFTEKRGQRWRYIFSRQWQRRVEYVDDRVRFAWNTHTAHPHHVVFRVDAPNFHATNDTITISHVTGHLCARPDACLFATRTDVTGSSMRFRDTVRSWHTMEAPPFHYALKATIDSVNLQFKEN